MNYTRVGFWRWMWHSIRHPTHYIHLFTYPNSSSLYVCTACCIATYEDD